MIWESFKYIQGACLKKLCRERIWRSTHIQRNFYSDNGFLAKSIGLGHTGIGKCKGESDGTVYMIHRLKKVPAETQRMDDVHYKNSKNVHVQGFVDTLKDNENKLNNQTTTGAIKKSACQLEMNNFNYAYRKERCY